LAQVCDVFGDPLESQSLQEGSVEVAIAARLTAALHVKWQPLHGKSDTVYTDKRG
jgi:hypothetical protein